MMKRNANQVSFPRQWTVFGVYPRASTQPDASAVADLPAGSCRRFGADPEMTPAPEDLRRMPASLKLGGVERSPRTAEAPDGTLDLATVLGQMQAGDSAYAYIPVRAETAGAVELGLGADWWMQVWVNGEPKLDTTAGGNLYSPVDGENHRIRADLRAGDNLLVVRLVSGSASSTLAAAGPAELHRREEARMRAEQTMPWKRRPPYFRVSAPERLVKTPDDRTAIMGGMRYTRKAGEEMLLFCQYQRVSDVMDEGFYCCSTDNGRTWSAPTAIYKRDPKTDALAMAAMTAPSGPVVRVSVNGDGNRNPFTGEVIVFSDTRERPAGANPDLPAHEWTQTALTYAISRDNGRTAGAYRPLIKQGAGFTARHPFDGLFLGQNQIYGLYEALFLDANTVLVPLCMSVLGPDGEVWRPSPYTYEHVVVLVGRRNGEDTVWDCAPPLQLDAQTESMAGLTEPTLGLLADGRVLLVMRGGNHYKPELPGRMWFAISSDQGRSWSKPGPWTYDTGELFFAPSAIPKLFAHSGGRLFWFGNIVPTNADAYANGRRYPLVVGEVDRQTGRLRRETLTVIADREAGMHRMIQFSNFGLYEDRLTHELVVCLPHFYPSATGQSYTGDLFRYRIEVGRPDQSLKGMATKGGAA